MCVSPCPERAIIKYPADMNVSPRPERAITYNCKFLSHEFRWAGQIYTRIHAHTAMKIHAVQYSFRWAPESETFKEYLIIFYKSAVPKQTTTITHRFQHGGKHELWRN